VQWRPVGGNKMLKNKKIFHLTFILIGIALSIILITPPVLSMPLNIGSFLTNQSNITGYLIIAIFCFIWGIYSSN